MLELVRIGLRTAHALAAVLWVGGSLFFALALIPALRRIGATAERLELATAVGREFRRLVRASIVIFLVTGAILAFDRLSRPGVPALYTALLGVKIALALWMFWLVRERDVPDRPATLATATAPSESGAAAASSEASALWHPCIRRQTLLLTLGIAVYLLAIVLRVIFEAAQAAQPRV
ncbi:MAG: hypothetical protein HY332_17395 [Chloroflexi bacterium]|nr:hypothetical protein [Chloroflexota bacterium]